MTKRLIVMLVAGMALSAQAQSQVETRDELDGLLSGPRIDARAEGDRPARFGQRGPQRRGADEGRDRAGEFGRRGPEGRGPGLPPELLEKFDADGDGKLSETERAALKADMETKRAAFIKPYDLDASGDLNEAEREAMQTAIKGKLEALKAEMLAKHDADGDGKLTGDERKAADAEARERIHAITGGFGLHGKHGERGGPGHEELRGKLLERFDADGDGKLSEEERQAAGDAMKNGTGHGRGRFEGERGPRGPEGVDREAMRAQLIEKFDADGDGKLNADEKKAAGEAMRKRMGADRGHRGEGRRPQRGLNADTNRDGVIDETELAAAAGLVASGDPKADFNRDGQVNSDDVVFLTERARRGN